MAKLFTPGLQTPTSLNPESYLHPFVNPSSSPRLCHALALNPNLQWRYLGRELKCNPKFYLPFRNSVDLSPDLQWTILRRKLKCTPRNFCFFSEGNSNKQEQARRALESALGGKKSEFDKWNKEIQKREEVGGGNNHGGGSWFGGGGWFGGSDGEHFWKEVQQAGLTIAGIIILYLLVAKGDVLLAVVCNSLLLVLRGTRNNFRSIFLLLNRRSSLEPESNEAANEISSNKLSAKESVIRKWGTD
ncbi:hypothetical protein AMTRI_Chr11g96210 [Amborella trichopoda]|uniref:Uncharacterized protein n=1 Tax=Amborella trichopoda TaxID=13333 RepID=U5D7Y2_AMBTC|nr:uncharacterized protein LOC18444807 [Amborella trichopoda]ERN16488.1 hypothetical protein AMTR_s00031p00037570 [Amborella trichopoda]|eukprot:XP_006855021.1 uncharacterized protein LOC18444807 [Amborella trichopoda]